jgi:hypothetical protein
MFGCTRKLWRKFEEKHDKIKEPFQNELD